MKHRKVIYGYFSERGKRKNNEDYVVVHEWKDMTLCVVCDGVGGMDMGEIASKTVAEAFKDYFSKRKKADTGELQKAVEFAMQRLKQTAERNNIRSNMASTLALLIIHHNTAYIGWIGDSRIYHIRDRHIIFKSEDHSLVNLLLKSGEISPDEVPHHPQRHVIIQSLSVGGSMPHISAYVDSCHTGDYFFLCSDGVTEALTDEELCEAIVTGTSIESALNTIKEKCFLKSGDNFSGIIVLINDGKKFGLCGRFLGQLRELWRKT